MEWLREECGRFPLAEIEKRLDYDAKNLRKVLKGLRAPSKLLVEKMETSRQRAENRA